MVWSASRSPTTCWRRCEDLIAQPGAPNLYWALTTLPRPLVNLRNQLEVEQKMVENLIPELAEAELARPRTDAEWTSLLSRMHEGIVKWSRNRNLSPENPADPLNHGLKILGESDLAQFKAKRLGRGEGISQDVANSPPSNSRRCPRIRSLHSTSPTVITQLWDDLFKGSYLPPRVALAEIRAADNRILAAKDGPLALFVRLTPAVDKVVAADVRLDRRVAILRVIEALRLYAPRTTVRCPSP